MRSTEGQGGFSYLLLLAALSVLALSLLKSQDGARMRHQADLEAELLFRGERIKSAIAAYQANGNGCFPVRMEQLLVDKRGQIVRYYLRQAWSDPLTGSKSWGLIYDPQGRWIGVRSTGRGVPRKKAGFGKGNEQFVKAKSYYDWTFKVESDPQAPWEC